MTEARRRFDALHGAASEAVWRYVRRTVPAGDRDDVYQETWLTILRACEERRLDVAHPRAYALRVARSRAVERGSGRRPGGLVEEPAAPASGDGEVSAALERALVRLSSEQREAFVLRHESGLSYEEMADVLDIPRGTAASRVHGAVLVLREALGETVGSRRSVTHDL